MKRSYVPFRTWLVIIIMTVALAACVSTPPPPLIPPATTPTPIPADTTTPAQRLAAITKIASVDDTELLVQPFHDLQIEDLRKAAKVKREAGDLAAAAAELDHALALVANDPAM
ncbi:MAG TPA: hypothetical protein ACQGQX_05155, partial [Xylella taiwanensis]